MMSKITYEVEIANLCGCGEIDSLFGDQTCSLNNVTALSVNKKLPLNTLYIAKIIKKIQINKIIKDRAKACKNCMLFSPIFFAF